MTYLAERYAYLLSKEDSLELFHKLEEAYKGNLSEACRKCGIQRKTYYDWTKAKNLRLSTNKKILKALIETKPEETLDFLLTLSKEIAVELLSMNLAQAYATAMTEAIDPRSFVDSIKKFDKIKRENIGLIWNIEEEIGDMTYHLREKARTLHVPLAAESIDVVKPSHILDMIPAVFDTIRRRGFVAPSQLAMELKAPEELVKTMFGATRILIYGVTPTEATQTEPCIKIGEFAPTTNVEYPKVWQGENHWLV